MCLIVLAHRQHPDYPFVFAANRDEFYERPTAPAAFWEEAPGLLAGRDLRAGGTWCGVTRTGRFSAITNYRDLRRHRPDAPSRGHLVTGFLLGDAAPAAYLEGVAREGHRYNGFNLLAREGNALAYYANEDGRVRELGPGVYGLSNHLLDTPWPKVVRARQALRDALRGPLDDPEPFFALLADDTPAPDDALPDTGVGAAWERVLSPVFIASEGYGTRTSTVVWIDRDGQVSFFERTFPTLDPAAATRRFTFRIEPAAEAA